MKFLSKYLEHINSKCGSELKSHICNLSFTEIQEICQNQILDINCGPGSVLQMTSAEYGHLAVGRCIKLEDDYLGCKNDVLHLLDRWCSGKQSCQVQVPNVDLDVSVILAREPRHQTKPKALMGPLC